jgi:hypothetical protein
LFEELIVIINSLIKKPVLKLNNLLFKKNEKNFEKAKFKIEYKKSLSKSQSSLVNNVHAFVNLLLFDDERWSEANSITVRGLGQQTHVSQTHAKLPCIMFLNQIE